MTQFQAIKKLPINLLCNYVTRGYYPKEHFKYIPMSSSHATEFWHQSKQMPLLYIRKILALQKYRELNQVKKTILKNKNGVASKSNVNAK